MLEGEGRVGEKRQLGRWEREALLKTSGVLIRVGGSPVGPALCLDRFLNKFALTMTELSQVRRAWPKVGGAEKSRWFRTFASLFDSCPLHSSLKCWNSPPPISTPFSC